MPPATASAGAPSAATSGGPAEAAIRDEVLNRYRGYIAAYTQAQIAVDPQNKELLSYLESPLRQNAVAFLEQTRQHGAAYRGQPQSNPSIAEIDLSAAPQHALVSDCYDATNFLLYFTQTNQPVPVKSGPRRYIIETTAENFGDRGWLFTESQAQPEKSC